MFGSRRRPFAVESRRSIVICKTVILGFRARGSLTLCASLVIFFSFLFFFILSIADYFCGKPQGRKFHGSSKHTTKEGGGYTCPPLKICQWCEFVQVCVCHGVTRHSRGPKSSPDTSEFPEHIIPQLSFLHGTTKKYDVGPPVRSHSRTVSFDNRQSSNRDSDRASQTRDRRRPRSAWRICVTDRALLGIATGARNTLK